MNTYSLSKLTEEERHRLLERPNLPGEDTLAAVRRIVEQVALEGDTAVREFNRRFSAVDMESFRVPIGEIDASAERVNPVVRNAIESAANQIERFHKIQVPTQLSVETLNGVFCRRIWRPIQTVGLYIPGGTAPLLSTVLMLGIPARLAGCRRVVLCTPAPANGKISPEVLYTAGYTGIREIYAIGGAQAIAAMAAGTSSVPRVDKIFGPGNKYVAAAKSLVSQPPYNVAIDLLAGPSELLVLADESADPVWVAADLLSQAEHGPGSKVVLVSDSPEFTERVINECNRQIATLPRRDLLLEAWRESVALLVPSIEEGLVFANEYAPEHLQLALRDAEQYVYRVENAGSVFVGPLSSVVFGDYASGTNHTLPTNFAARASGGVTVESFMKSLSVQTITRAGCLDLIPVVETLARAEGLEAHARAALCREG